LQPIAWATKAILLHSVDKDNEAKSALDLALKSNLPYVRWIHARIKADKERWSDADKELRQLFRFKHFELGARRFQSLVLAAHADKSALVGKKAVKEAQLALDLLPQPTWYSYLVLAIAQYSANDPTEALKSLERAERTASPSQKEMCQKIRLLIEERKDIEWDFLERTSPAVQP
jgi:tetratricopeptide (TPR) repeat protein